LGEGEMVEFDLVFGEKGSEASHVIRARDDKSSIITDSDNLTTQKKVDDQMTEEEQHKQKTEDLQRRSKVIATNVGGTVKWFNVKNGYGFITRNDTKEDVFVHQSAIIKSNSKKAGPFLGDGEMVVFDIVLGEKGNEASNVTRDLDYQRSGGILNKKEPNLTWKEHFKRKEILTMRAREVINVEALLEVDEDKVMEIMKKQVELVGGSEETYTSVDKAMKNLKSHPQLVEKQKDLYIWREKFFHENFKTLYMNDEYTNWITLGNDDSHCFDTVPYQITCNFDQLVKFSATKRVLDKNEDRFFLMCDEIKSNKAKKRFCREWQNFVKEEGIEESSEDSGEEELIHEEIPTFERFCLFEMESQMILECGQKYEGIDDDEDTDTDNESSIFTNYSNHRCCAMATGSRGKKSTKRRHLKNVSEKNLQTKRPKRPANLDCYFYQVLQKCTRRQNCHFVHRELAGNICKLHMFKKKCNENCEKLHLDYLEALPPVSLEELTRLKSLKSPILKYLNVNVV